MKHNPAKGAGGGGGGRSPARSQVQAPRLSANPILTHLDHSSTYNSRYRSQSTGCTMLTVITTDRDHSTGSDKCNLKIVSNEYPNDLFNWPASDVENGTMTADTRKVRLHPPGCIWPYNGHLGPTAQSFAHSSPVAAGSPVLCLLEDSVALTVCPKAQSYTS